MEPVEPRRATRADMASPVDLPPDEAGEGAGLGWATAAIAIACVVLALTNAVSINAWAAELDPSPASARIVAASEWWLGVSDRTGLGAPRAALHGAWKGAQATRFPGQPAADGPAD